jgi:hypothetical protein
MVSKEVGADEGAFGAVGDLAFIRKLERLDEAAERYNKRFSRMDPAMLDEFVQHFAYLYYMGTRELAEMAVVDDPRPMLRLRMRLDVLKELGLEVSLAIAEARRVRAKGIQPGRSEEE